MGPPGTLSDLLCVEWDVKLDTGYAIACGSDFVVVRSPRDCRHSVNNGQVLRAVAATEELCGLLS